MKHGASRLEAGMRKDRMSGGPPGFGEKVKSMELFDKTDIEVMFDVMKIWRQFSIVTLDQKRRRGVLADQGKTTT